MNRSLFSSVLIFSGIILVVTLMFLLRGVVVPFLLALILAYFLDPLADHLEKRGLSRTSSVVAVFAGFSIGAFLLLIFLVPSLKREFLAVQAVLPSYTESLIRFLPKDFLHLLGADGSEGALDLVRRIVGGFQNLSLDVLRQGFSFLSRAFSSTFGFFVAILGYGIMPIYLFYLLKDFDRMREGIMGCVPLRYRDPLSRISSEIDTVLSGFIRGQISVCMILAFLYSIGLLVIGIDLAIFVGIFSGLAFIIPYAGTIFGGGLALLLALVKFGDFLHPLYVLLWFAIVQGIEGVYLTPRIVGDRVGLHPITTILAVLAGGELFGFLGLLFAVPAAASAQVVLKSLLQSYRQTNWFTTTSKEIENG